jgi:cysteine desulfurase
MTEPVYLDHNATAPLRDAARDAALEAMAATGNASSVHAAGRRARALIEDARARVGELAGVAPRNVVFTSGGTEANALALLGCGCPRLLVSGIEHPSVLAVRADAQVIPVDGDGVLDLAALEAMLAAEDTPALVSVMAANNETGVIQPLAEVVRLAHAHSALVHCDAVQGAGRMALDDLGADLMTLSGHKLGGLQGAGALALAAGRDIAAVQRGGGQELGRRAGTEPLPAIVSFGAAATQAQGDDMDTIAGLRDGLQQAMLAAVPGARVMGAAAPRLANTLAIAHPRLEAETLVMAFDLEGIALSAGSACSSGKVGPSHVLEAMGEGALARNTIRISLGAGTTGADTARCAEVWQALDVRLGVGRNAA